MLKFTEFTEQNTDKVARELFDSDEYALEVLNSFDFSDEDVSYAIAYADGCILIRIFDYGRYMFLYPIEFAENCDVSAAVLKIAEYAMREEIGISFADVPRECVEGFLKLGFLHLEVDAEDEDSYRVRIKTECELAGDGIEFCHGKICLSEIKTADMPDYIAMMTDEDLNKFWGYNYKEDNEKPTVLSAFEEIKRERTLGQAITLGVYSDGILVGSAELFAFSGRGECEFAVRIARAYQGRGYGSAATEALIKLVSKIGIRKLSCDVLNENEKSVSLMQKYFTEVKSKHPDRRRFQKTI